MGRRYNKPPVIEVACEFFLPSDFPWDMTLPGLIYQSLKSEYPIKEKRLVPEMGSASQDQNTIQHNITVSERLCLYTQDRKELIQIASNLMVINRLVPYPGWDIFMPRVDDVFNKYVKAIGLEKIYKVGLKYVNHFAIPGSLQNMANYLDFMPYLGENLPPGIMSFFLGCMIDLCGNGDNVRMELATTSSTDPDQTTMRLILDYINTNQDLLTVEQGMPKIEEAHKHIEDIFEGCIKDPLRRIFEEVTV